MRRVVLVLALLALAASAALAWRLRPQKLSFYTDADTIRTPAEMARTRDILWRPPVRLAEPIGTPGDDYEPVLSPDELTLYFVRGKAGHGADIFTSTRTPTGWSDPQPLAAVNSRSDELGPEPSADGTALYFYSDREGGLGGYDLWVARRVGGTWQPATNLGSLINSEYNDYGPALSPDGRTLYFSSNRPRPTETELPGEDAWPATLREDLYRHDYDLYCAAITERGIGQALPLTALNSPQNDGAPAVSPAGDFLYFSSDRSGGCGGYDLYRSRRLRGGLEPPTALGPAINTEANELDAALGMGGYALYFSSDRTAGDSAEDKAPDYDVYHTTSREVFREEETFRARIDWSGLWSQIGPHLLWGLLALLLLAALLALWREAQQRRFNLLVRCLLGSLFVHLLLLLIFNFWSVTTSVADAVRRGGVRVALASPAMADGIAAQLRGELTEVSHSAAELTQRTPRPVEIHANPLDMTVTLAAARVEHVLTAAPEAEAAVADLSLPVFYTQTRRQAAARPAREPLEIAVPEVAEPTEPASPERIPEVRQADHAQPIPRRATPVVATQPLEPRAEVTLEPPREVAKAISGKLSRFQYAWAPSDALPPSPPGAEPRRVVASVFRPEALELALPAGVPIGADAAPDRAEGHSTEIAMVAALARSPRREPATEMVLAPATPIALDAPWTESGSPPEAPAETEYPIKDVREATLPTLRQAWLGQKGGTSALPPSMQLALPVLEEPEAAWPGETGTDFHVVEPHERPPRRLAAPRIQPDELVAGARALIEFSSDSIARSLEGVSFETAVSARPREAAAPPVFQPLTARLPGPDVEAPEFELRIPSETAAPMNRYAQRSERIRPRLVERMGGSDETERAVALGLDWLARHQSADGRWDADGFDARCGECGGMTNISADHALTGLALLCFLSADHTHTKPGAYQETVSGGLDWLMANQGPDGSLIGGETMYSHGIATIALSEAYGMTGDERLARPVREAARFIWGARNRGQGGWRYEPGQEGDTSVLGWQVMALRSASLAGIPVPREAFEMAGHWLDRVSTRSHGGLYAYQPGGRVTPAMTAEGMFVQQLLGLEREDARMHESAALIQDNLPDWDSALNTYYWYYATLAMLHHQGAEWRRWNEALSPQLVAHQHTLGGKAGSWDPEGKWATIGGRVYQTALCTLMLEVYYRYLPIYSFGEPVDAIGHLEGVVRNRLTGETLQGATITLNIPDARPIRVFTDARGRYELPVPRVPEHFAVSASGEGFVPDSRNVARETVRGSRLAVDFDLEPLGADIAAIEAEPQVHHLGNDLFEGAINSRFQKRAEGDEYAGDFELTADQLAPSVKAAEVWMLAKGVQCPHVIRINGHELEQRMSGSPEDGSFGEFAAPFNPAWLRDGPNRIEIRAVRCRGDLDDFEFVNLQIRMTH